MSLNSSAATSALALMGVFFLAPGAQAHVTVERSEVAANTGQKIVLRVPHGCDGQATNTVRVSIPEGAIDVKPMPKAGWSLSVTKGAYGKTYQLFGKPVSEGVKEIVWSKGELPDGFYDEFIFQARFAGDIAGQTVAVPVVQECATAKAAWTDVAAAGQNANSLKNPAPVIKVSAPQTAARAAFKAGAITVEAPWARATPAGAKIGGGYLTVRNDGKEADRLIGFSSPVAGRGEVHEMTMTDGVMKMREVKAIDIAPGASVELKPGGFHLMFVDLKEGLADGKRVKGQLVFEKAGPVDVEFSIAPIGAAGAANEHSHH